MTRTIASLLAISAFLLISPAVAPLSIPTNGDADASLVDSEFTSRPSIVIQGNGDFTAENGVVGGSGTPTDPYVIEGWAIDAGVTLGYYGYDGITIEDTTASFVVRDVLIYTSTPAGRGIRLESIEHGRVESSHLAVPGTGVSCWRCRDLVIAENDGSNGSGTVSVYHSQRVVIEHHRVGETGARIDIVSSTDVSLRDSTLAGRLRVAGSTNVTIRANSWRTGGILVEGLSPAQYSSLTISPDNFLGGRPIHYHVNCAGLRVDDGVIGQLIIANCTDVQVVGLVLANTSAAIQLVYVDGAVVEGNELTSNANGIVLSRVHGARIAQNVFIGNEQSIRVIDSTGITITKNAISHSGRGVELEHVSGGSFESNDIRENSIGVRVSDSDGLAFGNNTFRSNTYAAITLTGTTNISVRGNTIEDNREGITMWGAHSTDFRGNQFESNHEGGLVLTRSPYTTLVANNFTSDGVRLASYWSLLDLITLSISGDNLVNGLPLFYRKDCLYLPIDGIPIGQLIVVNCRGVYVSNVTIEDTTVGITALFVSDLSVTESRLANNILGLDIRAEKNIQITSSEIVGNELVGVNLRPSRCCGPITDVTLVNNSIAHNGYGVAVTWVKGVSITHNAFVRNQGPGLLLGTGGAYSEDANVANNTFSYNSLGVYLVGFRSGTIATNRFQANAREGVYIQWSKDLRLVNNRFEDDGIRIGGGYSRHLSYYTSHTITADNLVNGLPFYRITDCSDVDLSDVRAGQIYVVNCQNVRISSRIVNNTAVGIFMAFVQGVSIENLSFVDNFIGIELFDAARISIEDSDFVGNHDAIRISDTVGAGIRQNRFLGNSGSGLALSRSEDLDVRQNLVIGNGFGVEIWGSDKVTIASNLLTENDWGIFAHGYAGDCPAGCFYTGGGIEIRANGIRGNGVGVYLEAHDVNLTENDISMNVETGVELFRSASVRVFANNFVGNPVQASEERGWGNSRDNTWDAGYPSGGNYWSDYEGQDRCSGVDQDHCPDPDGIGDTPYKTGPRTADRFPLFRPFHPAGKRPIARFDVSVVNVEDVFWVSVDASSSHDAEDSSALLEVRWDWQDDGIWDTPWTIVKTAERNYTEAGPLNIRLQVRDLVGLTGETVRPAPIPDGTPPLILHGPADVSALDLTIAVNASITDSAGVAEVILYYRFAGEGDFLEVAMTLVKGKTYRTEILAPRNPGTLEYHIVATDSLGNAARSPLEGEYQMQVAGTDESSQRTEDASRPLTVGVTVLLGASVAALLVYLTRRIRRRR